MGICASSKSQPIRKQPILIDTLSENALDQKQTDFKFDVSDMIRLNQSKFKEDYTLQRVIYTRDEKNNQGNKVEILQVVHKISQQTRIAKIIYRAKDESNQIVIQKEIAILKHLDHPNVVKTYEYYIDQERVYIIMEFLQGGNLLDSIFKRGNKKTLTEYDISKIMRQVLYAVAYIHQKGLCHRDIRPENFLCESNDMNAQIKLTGFSTTGISGREFKYNRITGTIYYVAPEVLKREYDQKADIWSCGVMLYQMLSGTLPFKGKTETKIIQEINRGVIDLDNDDWAHISKEAKSLIKKLLTYSPDKRISAEQALQHPFFKINLGKSGVVTKSALMQLKDFHSSMKIQEAMLMFLIDLSGTQAEKEKLMKIFTELDTNKDGRLSRDELVQGYSKLTTKNEAELLVNRIMESIDGNQSGYVDYSEFVMATIDKRQLVTKERLQTVFKMIDKDHSGYLNLKELKQIFSGAHISDEIWNDLLYQIDSNNDGKISMNEFQLMMQQLIK